MRCINNNIIYCNIIWVVINYNNINITFNIMSKSGLGKAIQNRIDRKQRK